MKDQIRREETEIAENYLLCFLRCLLFKEDFGIRDKERC